MSNVIKKVFNTEKPEAEANKAQDAVNGAENNVHRGEGFLGDAKEKLSNLVPHHHQSAQGAATQAPQSATASQVPASASVSQGVPLSRRRFVRKFRVCPLRSPTPSVALV